MVVVVLGPLLRRVDPAVELADRPELLAVVAEEQIGVVGVDRARAASGLPSLACCGSCRRVAASLSCSCSRFCGLALRRPAGGRFGRRLGAGRCLVAAGAAPPQRRGRPSASRRPAVPLGALQFLELVFDPRAASPASRSPPLTAVSNSMRIAVDGRRPQPEQVVQVPGRRRRLAGDALGQQHPLDRVQPLVLPRVAGSRRRRRPAASGRGRSCPSCWPGTA